LWEAVEITLSLAAMARWVREDKGAPVLRRQREFFFGKTWDQVTGSFKSVQGASSGAVDQWINILDEVARANEPPGRFLTSLKSFLKIDNLQVKPLVVSWAKACDVPQDYKAADSVEVRVAMRYVNSFRNRLAHVPFPHDPLGEVADALEALTNQLFSTEPPPSSHERDGQSNPLTGGFKVGRCLLHGGLMEVLPEPESNGINFVFPCQRDCQQGEVWEANELVLVDSMMRPHMLTRLKGFSVCEYSRFRAEANAVLVKNDCDINRILAEPLKSEYAPAEPEVAENVPVGDADTPPVSRRPQELRMADAIEAIRSEEFDTAISYFEDLTAHNPNYHIAWLRLGYARREKAVRLPYSDRSEAIALLNAATDDFLKSAGHSDQDYAALAWYERSKCWYHLSRLDPDVPTHREHSKQDASKALQCSDEKKFYTWWDHLESRWST
jgi:hypothetical protein